MSREKEHIDPIIKEKLLQAEVSPPPAVWDGIEKALNQKEKRAAIVLYRRIGAVAALFLLAFLTYYFIRSDSAIAPDANKLAKQIAIDSLTKDSVSAKLTNENALAEKISGEKGTDENQKITNKINVGTTSIAIQESPHKSQKDGLSTITSNTNKYTTASDADRETIVFLESVFSNKVYSLHNSGIKAIRLLKSSAYKRALDLEKATDLLAELTSKEGSKGWTLGIAFSPTSVSRVSGFSTNEYGALYDDVSLGMSNFARVVSEKDLPAYSGGVNLEYQLSERWSFQSGIYYLKQGQRIENFSVVQNDLNASNSSNSYFGDIRFDNIEEINESALMTNFVQVSDAISFSYYNANLLQQFDLLEIPLLLNYKIINRKTLLSVISGINPNILVGNRVYLSDNTSNPVGKTESMNTLIYKSVLGISFEYPLSRKIYFNLSPTFKYQLNNFNKNAITDEHLQYFEFKTGLNYRF